MTTVSEPAPRVRRAWARRPLHDKLLRTAVRLGGLGAVAVFLANLHLPWRPSTLCILRQYTGVPCPFCGTTTAAVHMGHLDIVGAFAANPFVLLVIAIVATAPLTGAIRRWDALSGRRRVLICVALLFASEIWQLFRFGLLS
jgi:hypothetical protein